MIAVIGHLEVAAEQRADLVNVAELWASRDALEAFRGDGVDDETGAHIRAFHVQEYELA